MKPVQKDINIEKLDLPIRIIDEVISQIVPNYEELYDKINEIIDALNKLHYYEVEDSSLDNLKEFNKMISKKVG